MLLILIATCALLAPASAFAADSSGYNWFWFLYDRESSDAYNGFALRPFYMQFHKKGVTFDASLMPILFWRYSGEGKSHLRALLGLYSKNDYTHGNGVTDYDRGLFPFIFYGFGSSLDENDSYFLLWPFGGTVRGKLGQRKITAAVFPGVSLFFLFPPAGMFRSWILAAYAVLSFLPVYSSWELGDYKARGILWPLIMWGSGGGRNDVRVLPFFARMRKEGWYDNFSFLLLFNYSKQYFASDTRKTFFFFPLFGRKWSDSGRISSWTVLWPFFSWGRDTKTGTRIYNLPWPLVQIWDSDEPKMKRRIFFPFYGRVESDNSETLFVTPLFFRFSKKAETYESAYYTNLLIVWWRKRDYHVAHDTHGGYWRYFKIWPLMSVEYNERGYYSFNMLSLLPFRDEDGYERLYEPFWSLLEYRKFSDGERRLGLLLRTYYQRWGRDFFQSKVPFVYSYKSLSGRTADFSCLLSMFGYSHKADGRYLTILWIPFRIGEPDAEFAARASEEQAREVRERWRAVAPIALADAFAVCGKTSRWVSFSADFL